MDKILLLLFQKNIRNVLDLGGVYNILEDDTTNALDISDILRSELVMAVAILDQFIHSLIIEGMVEIYQKQRPITKNFNVFTISMYDHINLLQNSNEFRSIVQQWAHSKTFQGSCQISDGLKTISNKHLWKEVSKLMNCKGEYITEKLNRIVDRRNTIVHTYDMSPSGRWSINSNDIQNSVEFINRVGSTIFTVICK